MIAPAVAAAMPLVATAVFCVLCAGAAMQDILRFRIANAWSLALMALGVAALIVRPVDVAGHGLSFAIALAVGILLFALRWFGGGDAKFLAAASFAFRPVALPTLVLVIATTGAVVAIAAMARPGTLSERRARRIPYGLPIAIGAIVTAAGLGAYGSAGFW